jgi:hypothetical protein
MDSEGRGQPAAPRRWSSDCWTGGCPQPRRRRCPRRSSAQVLPSWRRRGVRGCARRWGPRPRTPPPDASAAHLGGPAPGRRVVEAQSSERLLLLGALRSSSSTLRTAGSSRPLGRRRSCGWARRVVGSCIGSLRSRRRTSVHAWVSGRRSCSDRPSRPPLTRRSLEGGGAPQHGATHRCTPRHEPVPGTGVDRRHEWSDTSDPLHRKGCPPRDETSWLASAAGDRRAAFAREGVRTRNCAVAHFR